MHTDWNHHPLKNGVSLAELIQKSIQSKRLKPGLSGDQSGFLFPVSFIHEQEFNLAIFISVTVLSLVDAAPSKGSTKASLKKKQTCAKDCANAF
ncbi:hypothetical protein YQE_08944, partial [Dendroctonus ponderosae]